MNNIMWNKQTKKYYKLVKVRYRQADCDEKCAFHNDCKQYGNQWRDLCVSLHSMDKDGNIEIGPGADTYLWEEIDPLYVDILKVKELTDE